MKARGAPDDKKRDRAERISELARKLGVARKVAKRRIRSYEAARKSGRI